MPLGKYKDGSPWRKHTVRQAETNRYPLRAVVDSGELLDPEHPNRDVDALECGHFLGGATDMVGRRYPARRRCWKCGPKEARDRQPTTEGDRGNG